MSSFGARWVAMPGLLVPKNIGQRTYEDVVTEYDEVFVAELGETWRQHSSRFASDKSGSPRAADPKIYF